jgi:hypothetical protein
MKRKINSVTNDVCLMFQIVRRIRVAVFSPRPTLYFVLFLPY